MYIEAGRIAESGSHNERLEKKGLYYDLYTSQHNAFLRESALGDEEETGAPAEAKSEALPEASAQPVLG